MNKVIQDGIELHDVTVTITKGKALVTENHPKGPKPEPTGGGGPGEEGDGGT